MNDTVFLILAGVVLFVLLSVTWPRNERNPHVDARRSWWQRNPK